MIRKLYCSLFLIGILVATAYSQDAPDKEDTKKDIPKKEDIPKGIPLGAGTKVEGLELPADQKVNFDEGFLTIQAKCKGEVKWLVISQVKVKYMTVPQSNSIIISVPPQGGTISVFAIGLVDSKLTDFARTVVSVGNTPNPGPKPPGPNPPPPPVTGPLHVTFLVDFNNTTPAMAKLLNSQTLVKSITDKGNFFRLYDINSPVVTQKKLKPFVDKVGGNKVIIIQKNDGSVVAAQVIPATEAEILAIVNKIGGN